MWNTKANSHTTTYPTKTSPQARKVSRFSQVAIVVLTHLMLLVTPFFFLFTTEELFEFNKMMLTYTLTVLMVGFWLVKMVAKGQIIFRRTVFDWPILIFVLSQVASTILSLHPRTSMLGYYTRFHGGLLSTLTYVALYYTWTSNLDKKHLSKLWITGLLAAGLVSIYAILERFGHSVSCLILSSGQSFGVDCWVQDVQTRVFATFGQPNWLAAYLVMLLPVLIAFGGSRWARAKISRSVILATTGILMMLALLFTGSRSGLLGWGLALVTMAILFVIHQYRHRLSLCSLKSSLSRWFWGMLGLLIGLAAIIGTEYTPPLTEVITNKLGYTSSTDSPPLGSQVAPITNQLELGGTDSGEIRKIVWRGTLDIWRRYPIFGSGVETFAYSYYRDRPLEHNLVSEWDFLYNKAHNEFLHLLATTGAVGLGAYLLLLTWVGVVGLVIIWRRSSDAFLADQRLIIIGLLGGIVGLSVTNFFGFSTVMVSILLFFYLAVMALVINYSNAHGNSSGQDGEIWVQLGLIGVVSLGVLLFLLQIYKMWSADLAFARGKALLQAGFWQEGLEKLTKATERSPNEALYYDELGHAYSQLAVTMVEGMATEDAEDGEAELDTFNQDIVGHFAQTAILASDMTLELNPVHLNFYRTRARIFINLAQLNPQFLEEARSALEQALVLAPTDAKLMYNLGLVELSLGNINQGIYRLEQAVQAKPDYTVAYLQLAQQYKAQGATDEVYRIYSKLVELEPNNEEFLETLENLQ